MREWNFERNQGIDPAESSCGSDRHVHWCCRECGHMWKATLGNRVINASGCPRGNLHGGNTLAEECKEIAADWDYEAELNQGKTPETIPPNHNEKCSWHCNECGHKWEAAPASRVRNSRIYKRTGCPRGYLHGGNTLANQHPEIAAEWDYSAPLNDGKRPETITPSHYETCSWICSDCGHRWDARPSSRVRSSRADKSGCPRSFLHGGNTLAERYPEIAAEWEYDAELNQGKTPETIPPNHNEKCAWRCSQCGHQWSATPANRVSHRSGCPRVYLHGGNTLAEQAPEIAADWDYSAEINQGKSPETIPPSHNKKCGWRCSQCGHQWSATPANRLHGRTGCPNHAWSVARIRRELSVLGGLFDLTPDERERRLRPTGLLYTSSRGQVIIEALLAGRLRPADYLSFLSAPEDDRADDLIDRLLLDPVLLSAVERRRPPISNPLRRRLYEHDDHRCCVCKLGPDDGVALSIDHFAPHTKGGPTVEENLWTLCKSCNSKKHNKLPTAEHVSAWLASGREVPDAYYELFPEDERAPQRLAA